MRLIEILEEFVVQIVIREGAAEPHTISFVLWRYNIHLLQVLKVFFEGVDR